VFLELVQPGVEDDSTDFDPEGPQIVIAGALSGALARIFGEGAREGRLVTARLASWLEANPDIEARLPVRVAQAIARSLLDDAVLRRLVDHEIRIQHIALLLLLTHRVEGLSEDQTLAALDEFADVMTGLMGGLSPSASREEVMTFRFSTVWPSAASVRLPRWRRSTPSSRLPANRPSRSRSQWSIARRC